jgi:hypothetical protein
MDNNMKEEDVEIGGAAAGMDLSDPNDQPTASDSLMEETDPQDQPT